MLRTPTLLLRARPTTTRHHHQHITHAISTATTTAMASLTTTRFPTMRIAPTLCAQVRQCSGTTSTSSTSSTSTQPLPSPAPSATASPPLDSAPEPKTASSSSTPSTMTQPTSAATGPSAPPISSAVQDALVRQSNEFAGELHGLLKQVAPAFSVDLHELQKLVLDIVSPTDRAAAENTEDVQSAWEKLQKTLSDKTMTQTRLDDTAESFITFLCRPLWRGDTTRRLAFAAVQESLVPQLANRSNTNEQSQTSLHKLMSDIFASKMPDGLDVCGVIDYRARKDPAFHRNSADEKPCTFREMLPQPLQSSTKTEAGDVLVIGDEAKSYCCRIKQTPGGLRWDIIHNHDKIRELADKDTKMAVEILHGPSGCGKTVAAMLAAVQSPNSRGVYMLGAEIFKDYDERLYNPEFWQGKLTERRAERDAWVTKAVVEAVCGGLGVSSYLFAPLRATLWLYVIIDEMGSRKHALRGLCRVREQVQKRIRERLGISQPTTSNDSNNTNSNNASDPTIHVRIIAVGTGCDGDSVAGSLPNSYRLHQVKMKTPLACWDSIVDALRHRSVEPEQALFANIDVATNRFAPAVLACLENPRVAFFFATHLREILRTLCRSPLSATDDKSNATAPSATRIASLSPALCASALHDFRVFNGLGRAQNAQVAMLDALSVCVNARATLPARTRHNLVCDFGIMVDTIELLPSSQEPHDPQAIIERHFERHRVPVGQVELVRAVNRYAVCSSDPDGDFKIRSWPAAMPRFRCPRPCAAIALSEFGHDFDATGSPVAGAFFEEDVYAATAIYARMPPLDPTMGDIVEATTHLRRIIDGLAIRGYVVCSALLVRICDKIDKTKDSPFVSDVGQLHARDEQKKKESEFVEKAKAGNALCEQLRDGLRNGDGFVLRNAEGAQAADVLVVSPSKLVFIQCKSRASRASLADNKPNLFSIAKTMGFYGYKDKAAAAAAAKAKQCVICEKKPSERNGRCSGCADLKLSPAVLKLLNVCLASHGTTKQEQQQQQQDPFIIDFVMLWRGRDGYDPSGSEKLRPTVPPSPQSSNCSTSAPNLELNHRGRRIVCRWHVVDATLRQKHVDGLEQAPLFPVAQKLVEEPPAINRTMDDRQARVCVRAVERDNRDNILRTTQN